MPHFESEGVNITELVEASRKSVSGKQPFDALLAFCRLVHIRSHEFWREQAVETARRYPLQTLFATSQLSSISPTPSALPTTPAPTETTANVTPQRNARPTPGEPTN